jgi:hypothetical protein
MSNSPLIPKSIKGRPSKVTLEILYEYIESSNKCREEREAQLQSELEAMFDNKFRSLEDKIQRHIDNKLLGFETQLQKMEARVQEIENQNQAQKQSRKEEEVEENSNLRDQIKELEEKLINNLALNSEEQIGYETYQRGNE